MVSLAQQTDRLALSARDLREITDWDDKVIEDYINILRDYIRLAVAVDDNINVDIDLINEVGLGQNQALANLSKRINSLLITQMTPVYKTVKIDEFPSISASSTPRQTIRNLKSEVAIIGTATITNIQTDSAVVNTNTPAGATAYALELKDESGLTLGYLPVYGSLW